MNLNLKKVLSSITLCAAGFILAAGLEYASAWTGPGASVPPSNNVLAPLNVSSAAQAKPGNLALGTTTTQSSVLDVEGTSYIKGLIVSSAFQLLPGAGVGKVLQSDSSGYATWVATSTLGVSSGSSGGSSGVAQVKAGTGVTLSPSTGTGTVTVSNSGVTSISGTNMTVTPSGGTGAVALKVSGTVVGGCYTTNNASNELGNSSWGTARYSANTCTATAATCNIIYDNEDDVVSSSHGGSGVATYAWLCTTN